MVVAVAPVSADLAAPAKPKRRWSIDMGDHWATPLGLKVLGKIKWAEWEEGGCTNWIHYHPKTTDDAASWSLEYTDGAISDDRWLTTHEANTLASVAALQFLGTCRGGGETLPPRYSLGVALLEGEHDLIIAEAAKVLGIEVDDA